ncbi:MAG: hypothetical protein H6550_11135 [Chitinophagales bacterium]|nr:hypothetical protein [Chitinophagales bacterium]
MSKKWALISLIYIAGMILMFYGIIRTKGVFQMFAIIGAGILMLIYGRMRSIYKDDK